MTPAEILRRRLASQRLTTPIGTDAAETVAWLGAVQSQDYGGAKWAVSQRLVGVDDAAIEAAFAAGRILRTHVLRPTWHFIAPADLRWMLALTAPRVRQAMGFNDRSIGLDAAIFARSNDAIARALEGGRQLIRDELRPAIEAAGVAIPTGQVLAHLVMHAELDLVAVSGARRGLQHTYAAFDDRVPPSPPLDRDQALAELASRYFRSHGPATIADFAWWSGLTVADARRGAQAAGLAEADGYYFVPSDPPPIPPGRVWLLPNYDEYTVAYKQRELFGDRERILFTNVVVVDGQVVGMWKRTVRKKAVEVDVEWFDEPRPAALADAAERYAGFLGLRLAPAAQDRVPG